ncbi:hypothetical protein [Ramlibacter albus]|uniref:Uncharacterized protein n=1 Tax=Ramlibacter albus TaxID=2079448 RepID=A0A923M599_9BURK|nr:hypothetical protein [Ramlibacter albus]MBC5764148.1 hypothetical protein [Ramlibacter albus]
MTDQEFNVLSGQIQALSMGLIAVMGSLSPSTARIAATKLQATLDVEGESTGNAARFEMCRQLVDAYIELLRIRSRGS